MRYAMLPVENSDMLACAVLAGREANGMKSLKALQ